MASVSTVPMVYDITGYGGDTLTIKVVVAAGIADGLDWNAQVKASRTTITPDATFAITEPATPGAPAFLTLSADETARLTGTATVVQMRAPDGSLYAVAKYSGFWDCQVSNAGSDPVTTLVQGTLTLETDVTRVP